MGKSAKLTRGGDKSRVNVGRKEAQLRAQGAKNHTALKESISGKVGKKVAMDKKAQIVKDTVKAYASAQGGSVVKMLPKHNAVFKPTAKKSAAKAE